MILVGCTDIGQRAILV